MPGQMKGIAIFFATMIGLTACFVSCNTFDDEFIEDAENEYSETIKENPTPNNGGDDAGEAGNGTAQTQTLTGVSIEPPDEDEIPLTIVIQAEVTFSLKLEYDNSEGWTECTENYLPIKWTSSEPKVSDKVDDSCGCECTFRAGEKPGETEITATVDQVSSLPVKLTVNQ